MADACLRCGAQAMPLRVPTCDFILPLCGCGRCYLYRREIAKAGHYYVEVYAQPVDHDLGPDPAVAGVTWHPISAYDTSDPADVFVAWRYHVSVALGEASRARYIWLQDLPSFNTFTPSFLERYVDGIFCLSQFHASLLPPHAQPWSLVTPNSLDPSFFVDGPNLPQRFVYGSAPNRGLEMVLRAWPQIRSSLVAPEPELWVYYGFTEAFIKYGRKTMPNFELWMDDMKALLQQDGVRYLGKVVYALGIGQGRSLMWEESSVVTLFLCGDAAAGRHGGP